MDMFSGKNTPNKSTMVDTVGLERTNYSDVGITVSPCKCRPDNGDPCFMLDKPKNNNICEDCKFLGGRTYKTNRELRTEWREDSLMKEECVFPGCTTRIMGKDSYCADCLSRIIARRRAWQRMNGDVEVPMDWLHRATMTNKQRGERKRNGMPRTAF